MAKTCPILSTGCTKDQCEWYSERSGICTVTLSCIKSIDINEYTKGIHELLRDIKTLLENKCNNTEHVLLLKFDSIIETLVEILKSNQLAAAKANEVKSAAEKAKRVSDCGPVR